MEDASIEILINGLELEWSNDCYLFRIEQLSEEIKELIENQFAEIWTGLVMTTDDPEFYTLERTVADFLDRYNDKSPKTKKGMIGELLSHLLINNFIDDLKPLSIMQNKEERSIKKGFDILYYDFPTKNIWYSEVKSGEATASESRPNNLTSSHLDNAKKALSEMLNSGRTTLWQSALIDVKLTIEESDRQRDLRELLKVDLDNNSPDEKSVVLISVLFHDLSERVTSEFVENYKEALIAEATFSSQILISIHKETYEAVETYLTSLAGASNA